MRRILGLFAALLAAGAALAQSPNATGRWEGSIEAPGTALKIRVDLVAGEDPPRGTIDIPAQGLRNFTLSDVEIEGPRVSFAMAGIPGNPRFQAKVEGDAMTGTLTQGAASLPFRLQRNPDARAENLGPNLAPPPSIAGVPGRGFEGIWLGALKTPVADLRLLVRLLRDENGEWTGTMDSIDQGARGLKLKDIEIEGSGLRFALRRIPASFFGDLNHDGSAIEGTWKQGGELPLVLHRQAGEPDTSRAQDPKPPFPYRQEDVRYRNEAAGIELAGTLTTPKTDGPHPAAILLSGSGPQDRDETIMGHRPFLVLADALTRRGFAVLRSDDRGVGGSGGNIQRSTTSDFANDSLAALRFLQSREELNAQRIGLIGHSEGALIAALAASRSDEVPFVVLLASPGMNGEEVIYSQSRLISKKMRIGEEAIEANQRLQREIFAVVKAEPDDAQAAAQIERIMKGYAAQMPAEGREAFSAANARTAVTPWFRFFLVHDPLEALREVSCPVLALWGENDMQVPPEENAPWVEDALAENADATVRRLPGLNHLFQHSDSGLPQEYARNEETFAPQALEVIGDWLQERFLDGGSER